jgi:hypothetical protein
MLSVNGVKFGECFAANAELSSETLSLTATGSEKV